MSGWAALAAVGGSLIDSWANNYNAKKQDERTLSMQRATPAAQMEGFRRAGLNPMLAYSRMEFPNSASNYTPSNFSSGITQSMQASAAMQQADTASHVGSAQAAFTRQQTETEKFRTAIAHNDAIKGNYALMDLAAQIDAAIQITKTANGTEALAELAKPRIRAGLQELRAAFASAKNDADVFEALNSKAVNIALDVLGRVTGMGNAISGAVDRYRARSQRGDIINLNKD